MISLAFHYSKIVRTLQSKTFKRIPRLVSRLSLTKFNAASHKMIHTWQDNHVFMVLNNSYKEHTRLFR